MINTYIVIVVVINCKTENLFKVDNTILKSFSLIIGHTACSKVKNLLEIYIFSSVGVSLEIINYSLLVLLFSACSYHHHVADCSQSISISRRGSSFEVGEGISIIEDQVDLPRSLNTINCVLRALGVGRPEVEVHVVKDVPGEQSNECQ